MIAEADPPDESMTAGEYGHEFDAAEIFLETAEEKISQRKNFFDDYRILGQFFGTYWIVEQGESIYIIDQHAAHERVLFETLMRSGQSGHSQRLLYSIKIELSQAERQTYLENENLFENLGFEINQSDEGIEITAMPSMMPSSANAGFFLEALDAISSRGGTDALKRSGAAMAACRAAIKARDRISEEEARSLIEDMLSLEDPFTCPHGRPTIVEMTKYEWEKKFKRIV